MPGTWTPLTNQPTFGVGTMLLLTDGTVMCQNSGTPHWWKLTPDITGSCASGTDPTRRRSQRASDPRKNLNTYKTKT